MTVAGLRRLSSWIDSYVEYTEILPSPLLMRKWAAISFIAAAMERKIWVTVSGSDLYPNLYTILVGPPGIGKGQAIRAGELIFREVPNMIIGPSDVTGAAMIDALGESVRRVVLLGDPPYVEFNSLCIIARELGVLIPSWDGSLMNSLTDIYDGFQVDQRRRGKERHIKIEHPQINLLGACTPAYLTATMPKEAWDQGFISRVLLVYSGERLPTDPFVENERASGMAQLHDNLLHDVKSISTAFGRCAFTSDTQTAIRAWLKNGSAPEPRHPRLQYYNSRRLAHLLKLCMVVSLSRSDDKIITLENYAEALNLLVEAEIQMPEIFKAMTTGGDSSPMEETLLYASALFAKEKRPLSEHRIIAFLRERVPAHNILNILQIMVRSGMLVAAPDQKGGITYRPATKLEQLEPKYETDPERGP